MRRAITVGDICELTGYSRDQLRGLLSELPRFGGKSGSPRVARVYSNQDVLVIVLLCRLEATFGLKRATVAALCEQIVETIATPRPVSAEARLVLVPRLSQCTYQDRVQHVDEGVVVPLGPIFHVIDTYLMPPQLPQREVGFSSVRKTGSPPVSDSYKKHTTAVGGRRDE